MRNNYTAESIEVLSGLDPVRRRPGMYTDTTRPNHLAQEVIDNSVDEALAGHADTITVTLYKDNSLEVVDNGRGMPVDIHPEHGISGVELILTRLHAGGKFSNKNYLFSGGLHGVGVSVVNALSSSLKVTIQRGGKVYQIAFKNGECSKALKVTNSCNKKTTGTKVHFWPDEKYFDSPRFSISKLVHILKAKAVLSPGLTVHFHNKVNNKSETWFFKSGLSDYLIASFKNTNTLPAEPFTGTFTTDTAAASWAIFWLPEEGDVVNESYVNLIPTPQGGTHVNGLRTGLLEGMREFCEFRSLLPRGIKLTADDIWERCAFVISAKMTDPQFSGQTKERLSSKEYASFISNVVKDSFSLWLNQHTDIGEELADFFINNAQKRLRKSKKISRKKAIHGPALPGKLFDCSSQDLKHTELFLVEGDSAGGSAKQARDRKFQAIMPLRGKILNTWEVDSAEILKSQEIHDISIAIGIDPNSPNLQKLRYGKICILADADSDGLHIATLLCALFLKHFYPLIEQNHIYVAMPPLYRIDCGKETAYALDEKEKKQILKRFQKKKGKVQIQRFKGLGEMNPLQLRETTMAKETRRLICLSAGNHKDTKQLMDMLLSKKRAADRKAWLESKGNLIEINQ